MNNELTKRDFIKGLAFGGGALMATSALPTLADDVSQFPKRGQWERLAVSIAHLKVGAKKPFAVLHVSDTHLTEAYPHEPHWVRTFATNRTQTFGGRQQEALRDTLEYARLHADYLVHTGDLIDFQTEKNLDLVKMYFGTGALQASMGNHEFELMSEKGMLYERSEAFKDQYRAKLASFYPQDPIFAAQTVNGVTFVTLDDVFGAVTEKQVALFKAEVAKGLPIILCMHVPFHSEQSWKVTRTYWSAERTKYDSRKFDNGREGSDRWNQLNDPVTRDFIAYLKTEKLLKGILTGHEHFHYNEEFSPTARQIIAPGNYLFAANLICID